MTPSRPPHRRRAGLADSRPRPKHSSLTRLAVVGAVVAGLAGSAWGATRLYDRLTGTASPGEARGGATPTAGASGATAAAPTPLPVEPWLTYHGDTRRTGTATRFPADSGQLRERWHSPALSGHVFAEPLVTGGRIIVATDEDVVYALDASDGHLLWQRQVGTADKRLGPRCTVPSQYGITGTPVIDAASDLIYLVAFVTPGQHLLVALDAAGGTVRFSRPIDPPSQNPFTIGQRGALAIAHGRVYIPFGGRFGDCGDYHGAVMASALDGAGPLLSFRMPTVLEGGLWATSGIALDDAGDLIVATGNSTAGEYSFVAGTYDYANSVLRLTPDLEVADWFAPPDWKKRNLADEDFGSAGPTMVSGERVLQVGKNGDTYLLDARQLGHDGPALARLPAVCTGVYGGTAYDPQTATAVLPCIDGVAALHVGPGDTITKAWFVGGFWATPPIIAGGRAWTLDTDKGILRAYALAGGKLAGELQVGAVQHFATAVVAGDVVVVATDRGVVAVSG